VTRPRFDDVSQLAAFLDSDQPFDLNTMRAAIVALVHRAVTADAKLHALRAELDALKARSVASG
jgi:hypothetical protein